ncbi:MAG: hypothetical protein H6686_11475 [Fibrobacteria bacterium]|nr:hypothetical protein [Fibrobacteria bacterium]
MITRLLLVLPLLLAGIVRAQDLVVEATGFGPTVEAATRAANRSAVELGIGQVLTSATEIQDFQLKKDLVLTRTEGVVRNSEVLSQQQGPDGAWEVKVRATVSKAGLDKDLAELGILRMQLDNPRIAVLVTEQVMGKLKVDGVVEAKVIEAFRSREFEVVEASAELRTQRASQIALATGGDAKAAAELGAELGAEVVILGTATATESDMSENPYFKNTGMKSSGGTVVLKAVEVTTSAILANQNGDAAMVNPNPDVAGSKALEKAAALVLEKKGFIDQILKTWRNQVNNGTVLRVRVRNIPNYAAAQVIQEELKVDAVQVVRRKLADGVLFLDVTWRGTADDFCAAVDGKKVNKNRNKLAVASAENKDVVLEVK